MFPFLNHLFLNALQVLKLCLVFVVKHIETFCVYCRVLGCTRHMQQI